MNYQIAKVLGIDDEGGSLRVRSVKPRTDFIQGGPMHGYRYEWGINHFSFSAMKSDTMLRLGLTEAEYDHWDNMFIHRFDREADEWYVSDVAKTYARMTE